MLWLLAFLSFLNVVHAFTSIRCINGVRHFAQSLKFGQLPYENDQTGFHMDAFFDDLLHGDETAKKVLQNPLFKKGYETRTLVYAAKKGSIDDLIQMYPNMKADAEKILQNIQFPTPKNRSDRLRYECTNSDLEAVVKVFHDGQRESGSVDIENGLFVHNVNVVQQAIYYNNLVLLRECLGMDEFDVFHPEVASADPNRVFDGKTPLIHAILLGRFDAAEIILKHPKTDPTKTTEFGFNARSVAQNFLPAVYEHSALRLLKRYPISAANKDFADACESCNGDNFALAILNGRSDECLNAHLWRMEGNASIEVIQAVLFMNRIDIFNRLIYEKRIKFTGSTRGIEAMIFETLKYVKAENLESFLRILRDLFRVFLSDDDDASKDVTYRPSALEQILTQNIPSAAIKFFVRYRMIDSYGIKLLIAWAFGRHDSELLKFITKFYPNHMKDYVDPFTNEPVIHIAIRKIYPTTRDLDFIKALVNIGVKVDAEFEHYETRKVWIKQKFDEPEQSWNLLGVFVPGDQSLFNKAFSYIHRKSFDDRLIKPLEKSVAYYLVAREDFDADLVNLLKPLLPEEQRNSFDEIISQQVKRPPRERAFYSQYGNLQGLSNIHLPEYWFHSYVMGRNDKPLDSDAQLMIEDFYPVGPEGNSLYHLLVSPRAKLQKKELQNAFNDLPRHLHDVNLLSINGEKLEGDVISKNWTALMVGVYREQWDIVKLLLARKANIFYTEPETLYNCATQLLDYLHEESKSSSDNN